MAFLWMLWQGCRCLLSVKCSRFSPLCGLLDRMRSVLGVLGVMWLVVSVFVTCPPTGVHMSQPMRRGATAGMA